jgi:tetratricopeptide (TPR) repeat protein
MHSNYSERKIFQPICDIVFDEKLLSINKNLDDNRKDKLQNVNPMILLEMAEAYLFKDQPEKALPLFLQCQPLIDKEPRMHHGLGLAYGLLRKYNESLLHLKRACEIEPENNDYQQNYALMCSRSDSNIVEEIQLKMNAALAYHKEGKIRLALDEYNLILALMPLHPIAIHYAGLAKCQLGNYNDGMALIDKSIELQPNNFEFEKNKKIILNSKIN